MPDRKKLADEIENLSPSTREWLRETLSNPIPDSETQRDFWKMMTVQRVANMAAVADDWADLSPEAKGWLRKADKEKIEQLNSTMEFMTSSKIIWKFLWVGGSMIVGAFVGFKVFWTTFGEYFTVKFK